MSVSNFGTNLGYTGFYSSLAVVFEYDGGVNLTGLYTDGAVPTGSDIDMTSSGVNLQSGDPLTVTLSYNASTTTLTETVTDTMTSSVFTHAYTVDALAAIGGATAYAGFTAASIEFKPGADLDITSWTLQ